MLAPTRMCQSSSCVGVSKLRFTLAASSWPFASSSITPLERLQISIKTLSCSSSLTYLRMLSLPSCLGTILWRSWDSSRFKTKPCPVNDRANRTALDLQVCTCQCIIVLSSTLGMTLAQDLDFGHVPNILPHESVQGLTMDWLRSTKGYLN